MLLDDPRLDYSRAAGLFIGEGNIGISCEGGVKHRLTVQLTNTDRTVLDYFHTLFGGAVYEDRRCRRNGWLPAWVWSVKSRQAKAFLEHCEPFMFGYKQEQARLALAFASYMQATFRERTEDVLAQREMYRQQIMDLSSKRRLAAHRAQVAKEAISA